MQFKKTSFSKDSFILSGSINCQSHFCTEILSFLTKRHWSRKLTFRCTHVYKRPKMVVFNEAMYVNHCSEYLTHKKQVIAVIVSNCNKPHTLHGLYFPFQLFN